MGDCLSPFVQFSHHFAHFASYVPSVSLSVSNISVSPNTPQGRSSEDSANIFSSPIKSPRDRVTTRGTGVFLDGRYSKKEVVDFGGIPEDAVFGV